MNRFKDIEKLNEWYYNSLINFKNKAKIKYNNYYDYYKFIYVNSKIKGQIWCKDIRL